MALPGTADTAKITIGWTYAATGILCENIVYLRDTSGAIFADPVGACDAVFTAVVAELVPISAAEIIWNAVGLEDVRTVPFGGILVPQTATPGTHSFTGQTIPSSACLSIKKSTATLGRSGRGRWYWGLGNSATLVGGDSTSAILANDISAALTGFQADVETALSPAEMGIVSYFTGGAQRVAGLFSQILSWNAADLTIDSQRRRLLGRGS